MSTERTAADRLLAHKAAIGDKSAMKEIYSLHVRYLTAVCSRYVVNTEDVKDILQDTFVKIFGSISGFKPSTEGSLRSWMTRITVNETLQFIRRKQRLLFTDLPDDDNSPAEPPPPTVTQSAPTESMTKYGVCPTVTAPFSTFSP